jgi:hypothetical protein
MAKKNKDIYLPTAGEVDKFERLSPLLDSIYEEMKEFSKKKPEELLNSLKVKMINKVLMQVKDFLVKDPNIEFLELLDDATLPSNSDTVLIIGQFRAILNQFKNRFYYYDSSVGGGTRWHTQEEP